MPDEPPPEPPKIIIDEDWKTRVEREKEALRRGEVPPQDAPAGAGPEPEEPLPEPSLAVLATSLAMQAMVALGFMPNPMTGKAEQHLDHARHAIDMLAMLQEKTQGNRTPEESLVLENLLHELRMGYVAAMRSGA